MTEQKHSNWGPSSAAIRLNCPGSARQVEGVKKKDTEFTTEGTIAHTLAQGILTFGTVSEAIEKLQFSLEETAKIDQEMLDYVDEYVSLVRRELRNGTLYIEKRIDYSSYIPEGWGTMDAGILGKKRLKIVDFKYGKGVLVEVRNNIQTLLYALGFYLEVYYLFDIKKIDLIICQPRMNNTEKWTITPQYLLKWAEQLPKAYQRSLDPNAPLIPGSWCQFCPSKRGCVGRANKALQLAQIKRSSIELPDVGLLSLEQIGYIKSRLPEFMAWARQIDNYALDLALKGQRVPGMKLVEGRRTTTFTENAEAVLSQHIPEEDLYDKKMIGITKIKSLLGKKQKEILPLITTTEPGKPSLVPLDDKRPEYTTLEQAFGVPDDEDE